MSLRIEQDGRVCRITLAAPDKRNVFDAAMGSDFLHEWSDADADSNTGAILIEADGPVFCGGSDPASPPPPELFSIAARATKPVVVAVRGAAVSAGVALVANAHVAIAAQGATFGLTGGRDGRWDDAKFEAVAAAVGWRRALELALTGRIFSTQEALAWGLLHMVAPAFELDDRVTDVATKLANAPADFVCAALRARRIP